MGPETEAVLPDQRAHALGAVNFVPAQGIGLHAQLFQGEGQTHKALHAVHMKDGLRGQPIAQRGDFRNGHDNARLVAYLHHADHGRVFRKHAFQRFQIHRTLPGQRNFHSLAAEAGLLLPAGILHRRMLGGGVEHFALAPQGLQMAQNGQIVAFCTAGGKDHVLCRNAQPVRQRLPGGGQFLFRLHGGAVQGGRVEVDPFHGMGHGVPHRPAGPGGGAVIQINHVVRASFSADYAR